MSLKKGDFILIDYVAKITETQQIFDTTMEEEAKKGGIFKNNFVYEPTLLVIGEGWVLKKLDDSLLGLDIKKPITVEIPPEQGMGERDPSKLRLIPLRKFKGQKFNPFTGMQVEIDGKQGIIRSVGAGRVQVDFNPPLAGKTLIYELEVKEILEKKSRKITALIHRRIPSLVIEKIKLKFTKNILNIELPEEVTNLEGVHLAKHGIVSDIQKFFQEIKTIIFSEKFIRKNSEEIK